MKEKIELVLGCVLCADFSAALAFFAFRRMWVAVQTHVHHEHIVEILLLPRRSPESVTHIADHLDADNLAHAQKYYTS